MQIILLLLKGIIGRDELQTASNHQEPVTEQPLSKVNRRIEPYPDYNNDQKKVDIEAGAVATKPLPKNEKKPKKVNNRQIRDSKKPNDGERDCYEYGDGRGNGRCSCDCTGHDCFNCVVCICVIGCGICYMAWCC